MHCNKKHRYSINQIWSGMLYGSKRADEFASLHSISIAYEHIWLTCTKSGFECPKGHGTFEQCLEIASQVEGAIVRGRIAPAILQPAAGRCARNAAGSGSRKVARRPESNCLAAPAIP